MMIDLKMMYFVLVALALIGILCVMTIKKILSIRSAWTTFLMFVEEIIGIVTLGYLVSLTYKAMENYEKFTEEYGSLADKFTYISIYFCASQVIILILIWIYKLIKRNTRMIKKRRIIK